MAAGRFALVDKGSEAAATVAVDQAAYLEEMRLPTMVICDWVKTTAEARVAERARICACLQNQLQLLNVESEYSGSQIQLL